MNIASTVKRYRKQTIALAVGLVLVAVMIVVLLSMNAQKKSQGSANPSDYSSPQTPAPKNTAAASNVPAGKLNLTNWKLTIPFDIDKDDSADEIKQPQLASYALAPYFTVNPAGVAFRANAGGATTENSSYPRSELREMTDSGRKRAKWSNTEGTHTMTIKESITHLPDVKPELVAGQIHDDSDDIVMIRLERNRLFVEADGKNIGDLDPNYKLGTTFTVKIVAADSMIKVIYNDALKVTYDKVGSDYYFKAGCYTQSNTDKGDNANAYGEVVIEDLQVVHT